MNTAHDAHQPDRAPRAPPRCPPCRRSIDGEAGDEVRVERAGAVPDDVDQQHAEQQADRDQPGRPAARAGSATSFARRLVGARRERLPRWRRWRSLVHLPVLAHEADRDHVHEQRDHEQRACRRRRSSCSSIDPVGVSPFAVAPMKAVIVSMRLARVEAVARHLAGGDQHDHRLADRARDAEHDRRDDARQRRREHHAQSRPGAWRRRARRRPRAATAAPADIASSEIEAIVGMIMKPMMIPAASALKMSTLRCEEVLQDVRREEGQREVAEDDRRHAGEQLEDRLDRLAHARRARTRTGRSRSRARAGSATSERDAGDQEGPDHERPDAEAAAARTAASTWSPSRKSPDADRRRRSRSSPAAARSTIPIVVRTEISAARNRSALITSSPQRRRAAPEARRPAPPAPAAVLRLPSAGGALGLLELAALALAAWLGGHRHDLRRRRRSAW